jgi:predicted glycosyltransferase
MRNDPWYASIESDPDASTRPDIRDLPKAQRKKGVTQKLVKMIVAYYDALAMDGMRNSADPVEQDWHQREMALADRQYEQNLQGIQQLLPKIGAGFAGP